MLNRMKSVLFRVAWPAALAAALLLVIAGSVPAADVTVRLKTINGGSSFEVQDMNGAQVLAIDSAGNLRMVPKTAPFPPVQGQIYFDSSLNVLRLYNGTYWSDIGGLVGDAVTITIEAGAIKINPNGVSTAELRTAGPPLEGQGLLYKSGSLTWEALPGSGTVTKVDTGKGLEGGQDRTAQSRL